MRDTAGPDSIEVVLVTQAARRPTGRERRSAGATVAGPPQQDTGQHVPTAPTPATSPGAQNRQETASLPAPTAKDTARLAKAPAPKRRTQPELVEAKTLYTSAALASRLGKATLADLDLTDPQERIIQLCNFEAVEQVRQQRPKLRAGFALAEARKAPTLSGLSVTADGAAIHGAGHWYDLSFRCEVSPELTGVTSFAFALGGEISPPERERLGLPSETMGE
ncbi:DUF930 domain-containing protein [Stappia sp.]|uniref:DUF930 domain-containing protein n=1 Tax=Stappia sp. TaxID=1870903 RepID=UPI003A9A272E